MSPFEILEAGQGDSTTGPVPSQMLKALITTITTTKMTTCAAIFPGVDFIDASLPCPLCTIPDARRLDPAKRRLTLVPP